MAATSRLIRRIALVLCVTLMVIAALGELTHDHAKCALENSVTCSSCTVVVAAVVTSTAVAIAAPPVPARTWATDPDVELPTGAPTGRPAARAPPAC